MASPFSIFRKNRKLMLAVLTLLAMFGFVFIPALMDSMGLKTSGKNPIAVSTKFGALHASDLQQIRNEHRRLIEILVTLVQASSQSPQYAQQIVESFMGRAAETDEETLNRWILSRTAEQMGMIISDTTINAFLKGLTQNKVPIATIQAQFKRQGMSDLKFFSAMRDELLGIQLKNMFQYSLLPMTPDQRWDYFNRVKEEASVEALAVPVDKFLSQISDPSEEKLKEFFEENKKNYALPDSATPGFHEAQRVNLQYLKADHDKLLAAVTEDEIKAQYEKDKALYDQIEKRAAEQKALQNPAGVEKKGEEGQKAPETKPESAVPPAAAGETKQPEQPKAPETPAATPETQKPEEPKTPEAQKPEEKKPGDVASVERRSPFMFAAYQEEKPAETSGTSAPAPEKPAETPKPAEASPAVATPPAEKPAEPAAQPAAAPAAEQGAAGAAGKEGEKTETPKAGPSEEVKKIIRQQIAREKLNKIYKDIDEQVERYRKEYTKYTVAKEKGQQVAEPEKLDLEKIAKEADLIPGSTGLITQVESQNTPFGLAFVSNRQPICLVAYSGLQTYRPEIAFDRGGNSYLFWKTEETKDRVPKFDDPGVRDNVLHTWKMIQARKLATDEAEKLADEVRKANKSMKDFFADRPDMKVIAPEPFSWMTFGNVAQGTGGRARLSEVAGLDYPGNDFMGMVFGLKPGEVGSAMNAPKTSAYVVRVVKSEPTDDALWAQFQVDDFSKYSSVASKDQQEVQEAWLTQVKSAADVKWTPEYLSSQFSDQNSGSSRYSE